MGLAETFALLREHATLAEVLRTLEARGEPRDPPPLPPNIVILSQERAKRQRLDAPPL